MALKVWPVFGARREIKHTSLTSPPPCFPGNFMETLKKFHQSFRTPKNAFWTPRNGFSAPSFHQKIAIWHQKNGFPTPNFLFRAPASRCTKNGQTHPCTRFAPVVHQYPPPSTKNWPNVLSQPGAWQHRSFYTQTLLHTDDFTHRRFDTRMLWHSDAFTHRRNRNFTSAFGDRTSFRAKVLRRTSWNRFFSSVFGDRTSFR